MTPISKLEVVLILIILAYSIYLLFSFQIIGKKD